jgi:hypothetical protein
VIVGPAPGELDPAWRINRDELTECLDPIPHAHVVCPPRVGSRTAVAPIHWAYRFASMK